MRILFCNKYNYPFSGAEAYIFQAMELLRSKGHEAALFSMADPRGEPSAYDRHFVRSLDFKAPGSWLHRAKLAGHAIYSIEARRKIRAMIADFRPDVAHVRNIYHHLSPSILWELKAQKIPVLYHLNDFKVLCPSYNLVSQGEACEACKGGHFRQMVTEKCYPGRAARLLLVAEAYVHKYAGTYKKCVGCFLAPSEFVRDKFVEHGFDKNQFEVLPHFQSVRISPDRSELNYPILYFGRLSREKGLDDLLRAMQRLPARHLKIAGDGPERQHLEQLSAELALKNAEFVGQLGGAQLENAIANSSFTVLPSHAYETLGKTILESYAWGRTVVASDLGSRRELVHDGQTGLLYKTGDVEQLAAALEFLSSRPDLADKMGQAGREQLLRSYTPERHYEILMKVYQRLVAGGKHDGEEKRAEGKKQAPHTVLTKSVSPIDLVSPLNRDPIPTRYPTTAIGLDAIPPPPRPMAQRKFLRVAFIGGRGVISKYTGIESYYEEVGTRLAGMGHEVTAYCRTYFTPPVLEHNGIKVTRLPTIRSKHLETLFHTFLSTLHVLAQPCDIVHYHALGPALFSFHSAPRRQEDRRYCARSGLAAQKVGSVCVGRASARRTRVRQSAHQHHGRLPRVASALLGNPWCGNGLYAEWRLNSRTAHPWEDSPLRTGAGNATFCFLGRFSPEKGCHLLLEAYER